MYKLCKTEQSSARQRQLEQQLLTMMLEKRFDDISISDLCQRQQIPRKAFYRYFSGKDGALFALLDHTMLEFFTKDLGSADHNAMGDLKHFFLFWHTHRDLLEALERSRLSGIIIERATILAQQEKLMPRKILSWSADLQGVAMAFAISGLMAMVFQWHHQRYQTSADEITQAAAALLTKPLLHSPRSEKHTPGD